MSECNEKYTVKSGDNLTKIANKYGTTVNAIVNANKSLIKNKNNIKVGWVLTIPTSETVTNPTVSSKPVTVVSESEVKKAFKEFCKEVETLASYQKLIKLIGED